LVCVLLYALWGFAADLLVRGLAPRAIRDNMVSMRFALLIAFLLPVFTLPVGHAYAQAELEASGSSEEPPAEPSARDIVVAYNTGFRLSIAPGVFIPTHGGRVGFFVAGDLRYGFLLGPVVLAPGLRPAFYFPSRQRIVTGLATLRLTFPIGPVGPFIVGGVGPGWIKHPSTVGVAYMGGGGLLVHIGTQFGVGAEATYQAITGTGFAAIFAGPLLLLAF
jgi:hypothetical protein